VCVCVCVYVCVVRVKKKINAFGAARTGLPGARV
jgi:hypothetical protein